MRGPLVCSRDLPGAEEGPVPALRSAVRLGLRGVHFPSARAISADLDPGGIREVAEAAGELGAVIGLGGGLLCGHRRESPEEWVVLGGGDRIAGLTRLLALVEPLGVRELTVMLGWEADRFDPVVTWPERFRATRDLLAELAPALRHAGARLLLKTHEESTTMELAELVETVGPDVLGIAFDPVNVLVRLEDPATSAACLAPYVRTVHVDDARIGRTADGFVRRLCRVGDGILDWPELLDRLRVPIVLDLHRAALAMPIADPGWLSAHPAAGPESLTAIARLSEADPPAEPGLDERRESGLEAVRSWTAAAGWTA